MHFCIVLAKKSGVRKHKGQAKIPYGHKKKEYRCTPTFVNLKSNTMKNTLQM